MQTIAVTKKCPYCIEKILKEATVCKHCKKELYSRRGKSTILRGFILILFSPLAIVAGPFAWLAISLMVGLGIGVIINGIIKLLTPPTF
jgi:hypothetical protein